MKHRGEIRAQWIRPLVHKQWFFSAGRWLVDAAVGPIPSLCFLPGQEAALQHDAFPGVGQLCLLSLPGGGSRHGELEPLQRLGGLLPCRACPRSPGGGQRSWGRIRHGHRSDFPLYKHGCDAPVFLIKLLSLLCQFACLTNKCLWLYLCKEPEGFAGGMTDLLRFERVYLVWMFYPNLSGNQAKPWRTGFPGDFQSSFSFGHIIIYKLPKLPLGVQRRRVSK